jgi:hypothetical protein
LTVSDGNLTQFRHALSQDGTIVISVGFREVDGAKVDAFLRQFGGAG